jgi:hypothetical protein
VIRPVLPELRDGQADTPVLTREFSSADHVLDAAGVADLLRRHGLLNGNGVELEAELLR